MCGFRFVRILALALLIVPLISPRPVSGSDVGENTLVIRGDSAQARMVVWQSPRARNRVDIVLNGVEALADQPTWLRANLATLRPNVLMQEGAGHILEITITGQDNQVSVAQAGFDALVTIDVVGQQNMTAVQQYGRGSTATVSQAGFRNTVAISQ